MQGKGGKDEGEMREGCRGEVGRMQGRCGKDEGEMREGCRGDAGRMKGRRGKDAGEMREGCRGDAGRMKGRCGKDAGETREGCRGDAGRMQGKGRKVDSEHAGTWDSAAVLALGHMASSKKILTNSKALKITACAAGANYGQSIKRQNTPDATCEDPGAIAGSSACPLHSTPAKGWAGHLSFPPTRPLDTPLPSPHIRNKVTPRE